MDNLLRRPVKKQLTAFQKQLERTKTQEYETILDYENINNSPLPPKLPPKLNAIQKHHASKTFSSYYLQYTLVKNTATQTQERCENLEKEREELERELNMKGRTRTFVSSVYKYIIARSIDFLAGFTGASRNASRFSLKDNLV